MTLFTFGGPKSQRGLILFLGEALSDHPHPLARAHKFTHTHGSQPQIVVIRGHGFIHFSLRSNFTKGDTLICRSIGSRSKEFKL